MRKETQRLVVQILKEYPQLQAQIKEREHEIKNPISKPDDNIGGGHAQNKSWDLYDHIVITLDEDKELHALQQKYTVIANCMADAGEETATIIQRLYFDRYPATITELIVKGEIWCSRSKAYHLRNRFIKEVAQGLNIAYL